MRRLTLAEVNRIRAIPGRSLLLYLTDRCPVGCAHCSVDARSDSPTIRDFALFEDIVAGICAQPELTTVGISGGEPFVERRGLTIAIDRLSSADKEIVLYTSGVWASDTVPEWIKHVLRPVSCVFLSTDAFHAAAIDDRRFVCAARSIADMGVWLIVQVLKLPDMVQKAYDLLERAFGTQYEQYAELSLIPPLPYGRGALVFHQQASRPGASFGPCSALSAPVVRYDGQITACCNEQLIKGLGPEQLRARCSSAVEVEAALSGFRADPVLNIIGGVGAGALTEHPRFADLADQPFSSICEMCWAAQERAAEPGERADRLLNVMALIGQPQA
jgi:organic radical activating enzyme